jgi:mono/diheme cytochrome c family protein
LAAFAGIFLVGGVWLGASARPAPAPHDALVVRGALIFRRERCFFCHTQNGSPAPAAFDPARSGPDLGHEGGRRTDDWHVAHLIDPGAVVGGSAMPAFAHLPQDDLTAIVAFLQAQGPLPRVTGAPETMSAISDSLENYRAGKALYQANCVGCHGAEGNGVGGVGQLLQPEPRDFTKVAWMSKQSDERLFAVIADGVPQTAMPGYRGVLSPNERAIIVRYLRYFADPVARQFMEQGLPRPLSTP